MTAPIRVKIVPNDLARAIAADLLTPPNGQPKPSQEQLDCCAGLVFRVLLTVECIRDTLDSEGEPMPDLAADGWSYCPTCGAQFPEREGRVECPVCCDPLPGAIQ